MNNDIFEQQQFDEHEQSYFKTLNEQNRNLICNGDSDIFRDAFGFITKKMQSGQLLTPEILRFCTYRAVKENNLQGEVSLVYQTDDPTCAASYRNGSITFNYDKIIRDLEKNCNGNNTTKNFYMLQTLFHEMAHGYHDSMEQEKDKNNTLYYWLQSSINFAKSKPAVYYKRSEDFIDEYNADILSYMFVLKFIGNNFSPALPAEVIYGFNREIADYIIARYYKLASLSGKVVLCSPMERFKKMKLTNFGLLGGNFDWKNYDEFSPGSSIIENISIPTVDAIEDFKMSVKAKRESAKNQFDALLMGEDTKLIDTIIKVGKGDINTINIFTLLQNEMIEDKEISSIQSNQK